jgi:cytochrome c peroxidase
MTRTFISAAALALLLAGCGESGSDDTASVPFSTKETLGEALFHDANLSFNRTQSCATCHNPAHAFVDGRDNGIGGAVSLGDDGSSLGDRNAPTAAYAMFSPAFFYDEVAGSWRGGQFHDGRETDLKGQAGGPPLNPAEMGMAAKGDVVTRIRENPAYLSSFTSLYGAAVFDDNNTAYAAMAEAIGKFEKTETFAPFDSRYDRYLKGEYTLTMQEDLGRSLFFSNANTNCANCHTLASSPAEVANETFSNYEYHNLGVPANPALFNHLGNDFVDTGLYRNPDVNDTAQRGKFKVPTLRNIALTAPYMHNGVFSQLETVLKFYEFRRDAASYPINPETGLAWSDAEVTETIDTLHLPSSKLLTEAKIDALIAFLKTLTDARYEHLLEGTE